MEEEHNLESPRVITIENTTEEPIVFQWRLTGNKEVVKPEDSIKFTVQTSEELSFFEDQFKELGIEYEKEEPTPPTPVVLETETISLTEDKTGVEIFISNIVNAVGEALYNSECWDKLLPSPASGNYIMFVGLGTTGYGKFGFYLDDVNRRICLGTTSNDGTGVIELVEGCVDEYTIGEALSAIFTSGPETGILPKYLLGSSVTYYTNGVRVTYDNGYDTATKDYAVEMPENYIVAVENPIPDFETQRVNTRDNSIAIDVSALCEVLNGLSETEYWYKYIEELREGDDIRPSFVLGKTANNEEFGLMYFATSDGGMKLWVGNETALIADKLYDGSTSSQISAAIGFMQPDAPETFTINTDTLGEYVDYYTDGILLRYLPDEESSEVEEVKVPLTMPTGYITPGEPVQ